MQLDSLKLFNRLTIFAKRDMTVQTSLQSELTPFLETEATNETVIQAGTAILKYIYHGRNTTLGEIRYNMFSMKAAAGVIKPEVLPPT